MESLYGQSDGSLRYRGDEYLSAAILPLLKLLSLTVFGVILVNPNIKLVPKPTFRLLSKIVFALFLPCTIFVQLGKTITLKNFFLWWFIPVNVILSTAIGCVLGFLVAIICRPPPEFFRFTIIMTGFGNTGNLPLAIVGSICHNKDNPFGPGCHSTGVAYVSFAQWISVLLVCTFVYHMMEPTLLEHHEGAGEESLEIQEVMTNTNDLSRPLLMEAEWPGMQENETEHCKTPFIAKVFTSASNSQTSIPEPDILEEGGEQSRSPKSIRCLAEPRMVRRIRVVAEQTPIYHILQPPMVATLLAFVVGMVPPIKSVVYGDDGPLKFITDSLDMMASPLVPAIMLVLGAMLAEGQSPNQSRLGTRTTIGIIVTRLLILPLAGIGVVYLAHKFNVLIHDDQMFKFVLMLQYTTPSAILLGSVATLRGYAVTEASALLFWQHICALLSLTLYIILYFKLLPYYALNAFSLKPEMLM